jgi:hypothetical protein
MQPSLSAFKQNTSYKNRCFVEKNVNIKGTCVSIALKNCPRGQNHFDIISAAYL